MNVQRSKKTKYELTGDDYDATLNGFKYTTSNRLFLAVLFSIVSVVVWDSVATGDLHVAPNSEIAEQLSGPGQRLAGQIDSLVQSGLTGAKRLRPDELATGRRLERLLGRRLRESAHEGAEFVDDFGRTFDALGGGSQASKFAKPRIICPSLSRIKCLAS